MYGIPSTKADTQVPERKLSDESEESEFDVPFWINTTHGGSTPPAPLSRMQIRSALPTILNFIEHTIISLSLMQGSPLHSLIISPTAAAMMKDCGAEGSNSY